MKMCLVMILVKKVFIFSKTMIICLLCPLLCGLFFFWKGAKGELSYKARKNPALQDSPPAAGRFCDILPFRRSAILPGALFHIIRDSIGISYDIKKNIPQNISYMKCSFLFLILIRNLIDRICHSIYVFVTI